ncbi:terpenoid cyclases/protein prenyltransferase alpha-alpha toroid [Melampsora americana]|nr:terpenoid cyclases/protein prenyltransferase alpha-alpha toroid [Melampsora americana]
MSNPTHSTGPGPLGSTDLTRWHVDTSQEGKVDWQYDNSSDRKLGLQSFESKYWLSIHSKGPPLPDPEGNPLKAAQNGLEFLKKLQSSDGHWSGEYGGPLFLIPGLVIACYITKTPFSEEVTKELARYLANEQRCGKSPRDQGWGLHVAGQSTVFGTALNYVACRLLGVDAEAPMLVRARGTLHALGGATGIPTWGKLWLSLLNVYDWEGLNPIPPEFWLLPEFIPAHPWRWWVHSRQVYLAMSYLWGKRFKTELNPLLRSLREELYVEGFDSIEWDQCRNLIAKEDLYTPHHPIADGLFKVLRVWEWICPKRLRESGLNRVYDLCKMEDENTNYQALAPVNKMMNLLISWDRDGAESESFKLHQANLHQFLWMTKKGMMVLATNGSQLWDLSFITQALVESTLANSNDQSTQETVNKALGWLDRCQIVENPKHYQSAYRHPTKGAWPFSTKDQGYTVSDCTAEALKSVLYLQEELEYTPKLVSKERLCWAVDVILSLQNSNGGYGSYELIRGPKWLEWLSPAEVFSNTMVEMCYVECTTACTTALSVFNKYHNDYRSEEISRARKSAIEFIRKEQREDGSWYGSWAVCFTYATMFALESLSLNSETYENSQSIQKACEFLIDRQMEDGGWGESFKSCELGIYIHDRRSQVVQTSWVILGLISVKFPDRSIIKKACRLIMSRQLRNGEWEAEAIEGVFNKTTSVMYPNYKFAWTIWALGKAYKEYPDIDWST